MREQAKLDPTRCPLCRYPWANHTTKGARECRADLARQRGEEPVVAVPRPPTDAERADIDRRAAERAGDLEPTPPVPAPARTVEVFTAPHRIAGSRARGVDPKAARAWAIANGHPVPTRGILSRPVVEAYLAANGNGAAVGTLERPQPAEPQVTASPAEDSAPTPDPPPIEQLLPAAIRRALADALRTIADQLEETR